MNFVYFVGGSGVKVAEAAAHLVAANQLFDGPMGQPKGVEFIFVDKDQNCGGTRYTIETVEQLVSIHGTDGHGLERTGAFPDARKEFCRPNISAAQWDFSEALNKVAGNGNTTLGQTLAPNATPEDKLLLDFFYTQGEQDADTVGGFYARPLVGSPIFSFMIKQEDIKERQTGAMSRDNIAYPVISYIRANPAEEVKVFVVGSIFGGTGSSVFSKVAEYIRKKSDELPNATGKVFISGALLLPYFSFPAPLNGTARIEPNNFLRKSAVSLREYANDPDLMRTPANPHGTFDCLYLAGNDDLHILSGVYADHAKEQKNHFDIVELVAAKAMVDFFNRQPDEHGDYHFAPDLRHNAVYEYRLSAGDIPMIGFQNLSGLMKPLTNMLVFSTFVICRVYAVLKLNPNDPYNNSLYKALYGNQLYSGFGHRPNNLFPQVAATINAKTDTIYNYCRRYIDFIYDIALSGHNWASPDLSDRTTNIFNIAYLQMIREVCACIDAGNMPILAQRVELMIRNGQYNINGTGFSSNDIMLQLEPRFEGKPAWYAANGIEAEQRLGDYLHEAYNIINALT